jgi:hypothetical protein
MYFCLVGLILIKREGEVGKGWERVNIVQILCTHECKCKKKNLLRLFQEWREGV